MTCTCAGKPSAPSGRLRAKKSGESVLLDWNAPYDDGGSRITSYAVDYKDVDSVVWQRAAVVDGYTRSVAIHGLRDAAVGDYLFRVIAVNEMGASEPLETDVSVRPSRPAAGLYGIAEFAGLEFAGLENDGLENDGLYQSTTKSLLQILLICQTL